MNIIDLTNKYEIIGLIDDVNPHRKGSMFGGYPILGGKEQFDLCKRKGVKYAVLAFGDCSARFRLGEFLENKGFILPTLVHPSAAIARHAEIGPGTIVDAMAVIKPRAKIGKNVIINSCSSVGHQCVVGDASHVCPGVCIGGGTKIGAATWVGIGSSVSDHLRIGSHSIVGAGAAIVGDIPDHVLVVGVPGKVKKQLKVKT